MSDRTTRFITAGDQDLWGALDSTRSWLKQQGVDLDPHYVETEGVRNPRVTLVGTATDEVWQKVANMPSFTVEGFTWQSAPETPQQRELRRRNETFAAIDQMQRLHLKVGEVLWKVMQIRGIHGFHNHWLITSLGVVDITVQFHDRGQLSEPVVFPVDYLWAEDWQSREERERR
jgi:hypothetical protein